MSPILPAKHSTSTGRAPLKGIKARKGPSLRLPLLQSAPGGGRTGAGNRWGSRPASCPAPRRSPPRPLPEPPPTGGARSSPRRTLADHCQPGPAGTQRPGGGTDRAKSRNPRVPARIYRQSASRRNDRPRSGDACQVCQVGFQVGGGLRLRLAAQATCPALDQRPRQFRRIHLRRAGRLTKELDLRRVLRQPLPDCGCRGQTAAVRDRQRLRGNLPDELLQESPACSGGCPALRPRGVEPAVRAARGPPGPAEPRVGPALPRSASGRSGKRGRTRPRRALAGNSRSCQRRPLPGLERQARRRGRCGRSPSRRRLRRPGRRPSARLPLSSQARRPRCTVPSTHANWPCAGVCRPPRHRSSRRARRSPAAACRFSGDPGDSRIHPEHSGRSSASRCVLRRRTSPQLRQCSLHP